MAPTRSRMRPETRLPAGRRRLVPTWDPRGVSDLAMLRDRMRQFADAREWGRFHDPKSVLLALVGEVGELAELFQWLPASEAGELARREPLRTRAGEEMADVLLYLVLLADVTGIDLAAAAQAKMDDSERRFPPAAARERH
jgi:dCTP diphosphatase